MRRSLLGEAGQRAVVKIEEVEAIARKKEADAFLAKAKTEVPEGVHTVD